LCARFESGGGNERDRPAKQARSIILSGRALIPGFGLHPEGLSVGSAWYRFSLFDPMYNECT